MRTVIWLSITLILLSIPFLLLYFNHRNYNKAQQKFREQFLRDPGNKLTSFTEIPSNYSHQQHETEAMPFLDLKVFFPYSDKRACLFETGGVGQGNAALLFEDGKFRNIAAELNLEGLKNEAAYCVAFEDIDNDGQLECITGYASGIYVQKQDSVGHAFGKMEILAEMPDISVPVDIAIADTRNRGLKDIYITTFVDRKNFRSARYHDLSRKRKNLFLLNNGDGSFTEQSKQAGLELIQNSYFAKFIDLDNDGYLDLVLSLNTDVGRIYKNNGDGTWTEKRLPIEYGFWMGLAIGKLRDTDEKVHILMSNIGNSFPVWMVRGDLKRDEVFDKDFALMEQVDGFEFKNVTKAKNLYSNVFGWNLALADLNNDGLKEAILTENYIKFPLGIHKHFPSEGKVFFQGKDGSFAPFQKEVGISNPHFGFRVLTYDFTGNGYQDVLFGNIDAPIKVFLNDGI